MRLVVDIDIQNRTLTLVEEHCCPRYAESLEHEDECVNAGKEPKPPKMLRWEGELAPFFAKLLGL